jgi:hypothetical protein
MQLKALPLHLVKSLKHQRDLLLVKRHFLQLKDLSLRKKMLNLV